MNPGTRVQVIRHDSLFFNCVGYVRRTNELNQIAVEIHKFGDNSTSSVAEAIMRRPVSERIYWFHLEELTSF